MITELSIEALKYLLIRSRYVRRENQGWQECTKAILVNNLTNNHKRQVYKVELDKVEFKDLSIVALSFWSNDESQHSAINT